MVDPIVDELGGRHMMNLFVWPLIVIDFVVALGTVASINHYVHVDVPTTAAFSRLGSMHAPAGILLRFGGSSINF